MKLPVALAALLLTLPAITHTSEDSARARSRAPEPGRDNLVRAATHGAPEAEAAATRAAVDRLNAAINAHDIEALMAATTDDFLFEDTSPQPDGTRFEGRAANRAFWTKWFAANPDARFEAEDTIVTGDRAVVRWVYRKIRQGQPWHIRGVDVFRVRDGKVCEKLAYVKG